MRISDWSSDVCSADLDQAMDRVEASSARDDAVVSLFARHGHADQILADALDGNVRLKLGIGDGIADSSDVARRLGEVRRGDEDGKLRHCGSLLAGTA